MNLWTLFTILVAIIIVGAVFWLFRAPKLAAPPPKTTKDVDDYMPKYKKKTVDKKAGKKME